MANQCCRPDPEFPLWVCPTCGTIMWRPEIELQVGFDREQFIAEIRKLSLRRIERAHPQHSEQHHE